MKKQIIATLSLSVMVLGVFAQSASALEIDKSADTNGHAQFAVDDDPGPTIDPGRPPTDPEEPPIMTGPLRFTVLPKLEFDNNNVISSADQNYYPKYQAAKWQGVDIDGGIPQKVVVEDVRGGKKGWNASVKHDGVFYQINDQQEKVSGGKTFKGQITFYNGFATSGSDLELPVMHDTLKRDMEVPATSEEAPIAKVPYSLSSGLLVTSDGSTPIEFFKAEPEKQGSGKNSLEFGLRSEPTTGVIGPNNAELEHRDGNLSPTEVSGLTGTKEDLTKKGRNRAVKLFIPVKGNNPVEADLPYQTTLVWTIQSVK